MLNDQSDLARFNQILIWSSEDESLSLINNSEREKNGWQSISAGFRRFRKRENSLSFPHKINRIADEHNKSTTDDNQISGQQRSKLLANRNTRWSCEWNVGK